MKFGEPINHSNEYIDDNTEMLALMEKYVLKITKEDGQENILVINTKPTPEDLVKLKKYKAAITTILKNKST